MTRRLVVLAAATVVSACLPGMVVRGGASLPATTRVVAIGDFGVGGTTEHALGAAVRRDTTNHATDVLLTLGDNDYTASPTAFRASWLDAFGWIASSALPVRGVLGNHDLEVQGGAYELDLLGMPRRYYTRRYGSVRFFFLDSNDVSSAQTSWLRSALAASRARWKIAVFHHPPFTCGGHSGNAAVRRAWLPLFSRYGVQLVLTGHDHNYQRFAARNGVRYIVDGGGGAPLYGLAHCPAWYPRRVAAAVRHGFLALTFGRDRLAGRAVTRSGYVLDRFSFAP